MHAGVVAISVGVTVFFALVAFSEAIGSKRGTKSSRLDAVMGLAPDKSKEQVRTKTRNPLKSLSTRIRKQAAKAPVGNDKNAGSKETQKMLAQAGVSLSARQFVLLRFAAAIAMGIVAFVICNQLSLGGRFILLLPLIGALVGFIAPAFIVKKLIKARQEKLRNALPDLMDLLVVSVEAGLGFDAALLRLSESDHSILMKEMMHAIRDIQRGVGRKDAYEALAQRCDIKEMTSFTNSMIQAELLGISVRTVLKTQAETLRGERRQRAEERALKAPVTMMIPLVLFIFPVIFIILMGPAVMNILDLMG